MPRELLERELLEWADEGNGSFTAKPPREIGGACRITQRADGNHAVHRLTKADHVWRASYLGAAPSLAEAMLVAQLHYERLKPARISEAAIKDRLIRRVRR